MTKDLLNRDQVKSGLVELRRRIVPQNMRGQSVGPTRQVFGGCLGQAGAQRVVADPSAGPISALAFGGEQRRARPKVVIVEMAPRL